MYFYVVDRDKERIVKRDLVLSLVLFHHHIIYLLTLYRELIINNDENGLIMYNNNY